jgi:6-hydroxytryprostatin B O-methyltransferase
MASIIPTTGTMPIADLSDKCDLPVDIVARVTRQAMSYGAFSEPKQGHIAHTDVSLEIPRLSPLLSYQLEVCLPSMARFQDWLEDENKEHKSAFQIAHNTTDTWWSYASKRPELIENYGRYMALITTGGAHDVSYVLQGFAWGQLGTSLVVDVGIPLPRRCI